MHYSSGFGDKNWIKLGIVLPLAIIFCTVRLFFMLSDNLAVQVHLISTLLSCRCALSLRLFGAHWLFLLSNWANLWFCQSLSWPPSKSFSADLAIIGVTGDDGKSMGHGFYWFPHSEVRCIEQLGTFDYFLTFIDRPGFFLLLICLFSLPGVFWSPKHWFCSSVASVIWHHVFPEPFINSKDFLLKQKAGLGYKLVKWTG